MRKPLLLVLNIFISLTLFGQITVTDSVLPNVGDTLKMSIVPSFDTWTPDTGGPNMSWDFSNVTAFGPDNQIFSDPSTGAYAAEFPNADLLNSDGAAEAYFSKDSDGIHLIGFSGENPVTNEEVAIAFDNPHTQVHTPMVYDESWSAENSVYVGISLDSIDQDILDMIPFMFDTARLKITFSNVADFDAWGDITTPTGTYSALREKRVSMTTFGVEIFFFTWIDVTSNLPANDFFENDTTTTYTFFNDVEKEPIAEVTTTSSFDQQTLRYKDDMIVSNSNINQTQQTFRASPNPAINDISFYYSGLTEGQYELNIYNIIGTQLINEKFKANSASGAYYTDVSSLRQGTYFYSLKDKYGNTITTKRLIIIRP